jgi:uncharacterized membrane protein YcaP (DUF421 family)
MTELVGGGAGLGWVAVKALLLYLTAVVGFRVGDRRTLAEMSPFDFVAAVAVGAIVGRVPNASETSYLAGAITLATLLIAHRLLMRLRYIPSLAHLIERTPRVLVADGQVVERELRRCGLTYADLYSQLRQSGVGELAEVRYLIFEPSGQLSLIRRTEANSPLPELVRDAVAPAAARP